MQNSVQYSLKILLLLTLVAGMGCTTSSPTYEAIENTPLKIERISSDIAYIGSVSVSQEQSSTIIIGQVKRRYRSHSSILGHVDIEIFRTDGSVIIKKDITYKKKSLKSNIATFKVVVDHKLQDGDTVRIKHHYKDGYSYSS